MARNGGQGKNGAGKRRVKKEMTTNGGDRPRVISKVTHLRSYAVNGSVGFVEVPLPNGVIRHVPFRTYLQFVAEATRRKQTVAKYIYDLHREARGE